MDSGYRVTISRKDILDYDIPVLQDLLHRLLGVEKALFNQRFRTAEELAFDCDICLDSVQESLLLLEERGFKAQASKRRNNSVMNNCFFEGAALDGSQPAVTLSDDECRVLLHSRSPGIARFAQYKNLVTFACGCLVLSSYLLMIFYSV